MGAKQDVSVARTAQDIERKYKFGKTFAELLGLINDNRDKVDTVESSLSNKIIKQETELKRNTAEIVATAKEETYEEINGQVNEIKKSVELKMDSAAVNIAIAKAVQEGATRVVTKMGYSFDDEGINVSKSSSEISNRIDHTGMYVEKSGNEVLTANADGVKATDLHANTYLIIGQGNGRSRFEDYGTNRTACFWIGG